MSDKQDDLIEWLREEERDLNDAIARLDFGEFDNGGMTVIRYERRDRFKRAADRIEALQAEVERLKADIDEHRAVNDKAALRAAIDDALAAQQGGDDGAI